MSTKIVVASKNPVKIKAVISAFKAMFPEMIWETEGISVNSGVSEQPQNDQETLKGAYNRAENASKKIKADYWVGIEGGVEEKDCGMEVFAWVVVKSKHGKFGRGRTGSFFLPSKVAELIKQGKELGEADDIVFGKTNSKQENGAVGILTDNIIDRKELYKNAVILALIPFKNKDLYN
ncbi:MAG: inosine/xanthosine triphosphatase [Patescibacteria group bacterium]|nr:inosine/xanthosine triphosphatase [Patescibacteria group bacterium]